MHRVIEGMAALAEHTCVATSQDNCKVKGTMLLQLHSQSCTPFRIAVPRPAKFEYSLDLEMPAQQNRMDMSVLCVSLPRPHNMACPEASGSPALCWQISDPWHLPPSESVCTIQVTKLPRMFSHHCKLVLLHLLTPYSVPGVIYHCPAPHRLHDVSAAPSRILKVL